ncbi:fimbrial protein [Klebsiella grimontii]|uniref:fimbrial protein n=1 Tax=Klebsiella grimontii TaxID=2058152 RepID=UPI00300C70C9
MRIKANRLFRAINRGIFALLALGGMLSSAAQATPCELTSAYGFNNQDVIPILGTGLSTVGEDLPVGSVIYNVSDNVARGLGKSLKYECPDMEGTEKIFVYRSLNVISQPSGAPTISGGEAIYPTNVPGIGVVFTFRSFTGPMVSVFPDYKEEDFSMGNGVIINIQAIQMAIFKLVKTGPVDNSASQKVDASSFPVFQIIVGVRGFDPKEEIVHTIRFGGQLTLYTKTCQLVNTDINVDLGSHMLSDFNGVSSASQWKNFDITLKDCPPFKGYGTYSGKFGELTGGSVKDNEVNIKFNSAYGSVPGNNYLAMIESKPGSAEGVGIELSRRDESLGIAMDGSGGFDLKQLITDGSTLINIPLKARYVQYDENIKPGSANSAVVFTITYE